MQEIIKNFNKQFQIGYDSTTDLVIPANKKGICVCGIGGSALPGNLLKLYLEEKNIDIPLAIERSYDLPKGINHDWLVICISYSGNTEEALSCLKQAQEKELDIALISSNGEFKKIAEQNNIPIAIMPKGIQPRMALGYQLSALLGILEKAGLIEKPEDILELKNIVPEIQKDYAKNLAKKINGNIPIIYASNKLKIIARICKIGFNENSKSPAFWNYFPELNHNEMVGFTKKNNLDNRNFYFIIFKDLNDHPRIQERMDLTKKILEKQEIKGEIIELKGKSLLEKVFYGIILSYWTSYYLALSYNIDPEPVNLVEDFKKLL
ncbi:bifunctional phosphoglucose/phosphomannose isomerase [Patescibacteria group bacterium]|nr:bifunctional phosphoglucose/phosphomannose isomerase [Patescibacteria group bacterium]MBU4023190.1 bifunctional phosphoglucose/phosphomannose isomerase [Patescibacteria group bacterium]MBU4078479.1 bifunctional phosphoglucose/phosphomannose isomerase [Patescibacteria group bacterium]